MNKMYKTSILELIQKLRTVRELNQASTDLLYIEMHNDTLNDLLMNPDLDLYIGHQGVVGREALEQLFNARIFTHNDSNKRYIFTVTHRTDFLIGEKDDNKVSTSE